MKPKPKEWTEVEQKALIRLARDGAQVREITSKLGRYTRSVRRMAQELKLVIQKGQPPKNTVITN